MSFLERMGTRFVFASQVIESEGSGKGVSVPLGGA